MKLTDDLQIYFGTLLSPEESFEKMNHSSRWGYAYLILTISMLVFTYVTREAKMNDWINEIRHDKSLSYEEIDQHIRNIEFQSKSSGRYIGLFTIPILTLIQFLGTSFSLWLIISFITSGITIKKMLVIYSNSTIVQIVGFCFQLPIAIIKKTLSLNFDLGTMFSLISINNEFTPFLGKFNFFVLWQVFLLGIGLSVSCHINRIKSLIIVFSLWLIWVFISLSLSNAISIK